MQTVRAADTNEVVKLIFRESDNDRKVSGSLLRAATSHPQPEEWELCRALKHL